MFKAGFARVEVTPPLGTYIPGYFEKRWSNGILDPLYLNALAYTDGEKTNVLIACDLLSIKMNESAEIRELIAKETGIDKDAVFTCVLHQHTSFALRPDDFSVPSPEFRKVLSRKFVDVAKMAIDDLDDAEAYTAQKETPEPVSFVRRYVMRDGRIATNPGYGNPDIVRPVSDADNTVRLVRFKRARSSDIALVNFSTHPDVVGGEKYSADWPGFVRNYVERDIGDVRCIVLNGAQGDVNHINVNTPSLLPDVPSGCYDYRYSRRMGRIIADTVRDIWETGVLHPEGRLFSEVRIVDTPSNREGAEKLPEALALIKDHDENGTYYTIEQLGAAKRVIKLAATPETVQVPVSAQGFSDIVFVGFGGEPFTEYANEMRRAAPGSFVITTCITNGGEGYLATEAAFSEGGYESRSSRFTSRLPGDLWGAAKDILRKYDVK
ncbi:MAG: hypothetical protein IJS65_04640 [Clostridia bacterium]|nr:hypothetical protein [Clostridia bacterium]